ncbi:hypothetical protein D9611_010147 [Ephemerocybe angulata]|uniref:Uncharacterized protein n=1 Tax=Ephemerocybe angulata TaxID=980116 RepID=A0A8H5EVC1_9AGAR|nr:hypothetical protein D9611_010147 [Tulosesus angulatus]
MAIVVCNIDLCLEDPARLWCGEATYSSHTPARTVGSPGRGVRAAVDEVVRARADWNGAEIPRDLRASLPPESAISTTYLGSLAP